MVGEDFNIRVLGRHKQLIESRFNLFFWGPYFSNVCPQIIYYSHWVCDHHHLKFWYNFIVCIYI